MTETLSKCPVCDTESLEDHSQCPDHFLSKEVFAIQRCKSCKVLVTNPRPDQKTSIKYYKSDSYVSHRNQSNSLINRIYKVVRSITLKRKLKMLERFSFKGKLLDYGCGTGHFIDYASKHGWQVRGIEPDTDARENLPSSVKEQVVPSIDELSTDQRFQVITLFHVLEHVHQLEDTLQTLINLLDSNGVLFLALPNHMSADAQKYGTYWAGYDVPRHLYHFNQRSVFQLSKKYGLNIVSTIPMTFDSYYVSMLSEKYMGHSATMLNGFINGYKSNKRARKTKEYSSLIYVLTK